MLIVSDAWRAAFPGAAAGLLAMRDVVNPASHEALDHRRAEVEARLRERYGRLSRAEIVALASVKPYADYYGRFDKTYHVQLQLESVALKGKPLPRGAGLVGAMFMAELENQMLTAGHDGDALDGPVHLDVARGDEDYVLFNGKTQALKAGDMFMRDGRGVISSVLYGPDQRTQIRVTTRQVVFAVYAPPGVDPARVTGHLDTIAGNVRLIAPAAAVVTSTVYPA
jgi:DNA/RNA-binding domain of Phe-tRNA-synthetase-like protein